MWLYLCILLFAIRWKVDTAYPGLATQIPEWIFIIILILAGVCYGVEHYLKYSRRKLEVELLSSSALVNIKEFASIFIPCLFLFLIKTFVFDINIVASGSMRPTLQVGDVVIVNKHRYGFRMPFTGKQLIPFALPKRGDIATFTLPKGQSKRLIKRVVGIPGDVIEYKNKYLSVNGKKAHQTFLSLIEHQEQGMSQAIIHSEEDLIGHKYSIYKALESQLPTHYQSSQDFSLIVPQGHYFIIGDNRDNSSDSRSWGFLPQDYLIGKAYRIILSWKTDAHLLNPLSWIRWDRFNTTVV